MEEFDLETADVPALIARAGLKTSAGTVYAIDRDLRLAYMNDDWRYFGIANGGGDMLVQWPRGRGVMESVPEVLREHFSEMYRRAFDGEVVRHLYQCSGPGVYREFEMTMVATAKRHFVLAFNTPVVEKSLLYGLDVGYGSAIAMYAGKRRRVTQCAHCRKAKRVGRDDQWDFVPLLLQFNFFESTDVLCPFCVEWHAAQRARWSESRSP